MQKQKLGGQNGKEAKKQFEREKKEDGVDSCPKTPLLIVRLAFTYAFARNKGPLFRRETK